VPGLTAASGGGDEPVAARLERAPRQAPGEAESVDAGDSGAHEAAPHGDKPRALAGSAVGFYATSIALSIPQPLRRAWRAIRERSLDINALMVIAVVGAILLDDWMEAAAVVWLAGSQSAFVSGQTLLVDGGVFSQAVWPDY